MSKYLTSFTIGALLHEESTQIIPLLLHDDNEGIEAEIITGNLTKINAQASRKRKILEIKRRFEQSDNSLWEYFINASASEQKAILYYNCLKTYQILQDFHIEILMDKWSKYDLELTNTDYSSFLFSKSDQHPEILEWTTNTQTKLIQIAKLMLKEVGILEGNKLRQLYLPDSFWEFFINMGELWYLEAMFLNINDIKKLISKR